jgi:hypothetical protein
LLPKQVWYLDWMQVLQVWQQLLLSQRFCLEQWQFLVLHRLQVYRLLQHLIRHESR